MVFAQGRQLNLWSFFTPFSYGVWLMLVLVTFVVGISTWITDHLSPYGLARTEKHEKNAFDFSHSMINSFSVIMGKEGERGKSWATRLCMIGKYFLT